MSSASKPNPYLAMASSKEQKCEKYREDGKSVKITESNDPNRTSFQWLKRKARGKAASANTRPTRPGANNTTSRLYIF
jgi:hypothetical protein